MTTNNSLNAPIPFSATKGGSGVASPTVHGILVAEGSSPFATKVLTNGQLLIGSTGSDPVAATITDGAGISHSTGAGSLTITNTAPGMSKVDQTSSTVTMASDNRYVTDNGASEVTYTLPTSGAVGDQVEVIGFSSGGWKIAQAASQLIHFGDQTTTTGTGGSLEFTNAFDSVVLVCAVATTTWVVKNVQGNLTVV